MPIIKSAKKRVRVAAKATARNSKTKRMLKSALKLFARKPSTSAHSSAQSALDKAAKKGVMHKNKAARMKSRLAAKAKASSTTHTTKKAATKKPATTKKTTATKKAAPAKKSTTKKTAPKKK